MMAMLLYLIFFAWASLWYTSDLPAPGHLRRGVPEFLQRMHNKGDQDSLTVVYLGGSITEQEGWRDMTFDHISSQVNSPPLRQINAAIGGTNSRFAAYRLPDHVLAYDPDLVIIEFAVNDYNLPEEYIMESMEGIVRQLRWSSSAPSILFVYTLREDFLSSYAQGRLPGSVLAMEKVARHYGIPSINFGPGMISTLAAPSHYSHSEYSVDGVHPTLAGHRRYAQLFNTFFHRLVKHSGGMPAGPPGDPLTPSPVEHVVYLPFSHLPDKQGWQPLTEDEKLYEKFLPFDRNAMLSRNREAAVSFCFRGKAFGIADLVGPDTGAWLVSVDSLPAETVERYDQYASYHRISYFEQWVKGDTLHYVTLRRKMSLPDKSGLGLSASGSGYSLEGNNLYPIGLFIRGSFCECPEK